MMTDRPARHYGLRHRGRIADGFHADLVVFDADEVATLPATVLHDLPGGGERLYAGSRGVDHVFVGGSEVVVDGEVTDERPGPGPALGARYRDGVAGRCQAVAAPSMTRVVPLTVAASSEAR